METRHRILYGTAASRLGDLADASVDLIVTSPPYPMITMWDEQFVAGDASIATALEAGEGMAAYDRMHRLLDEVWRECARVVRPGGFVCINIGDATRTVADTFRLYTNHTRITSAWERLGFHSLPPILWWKPTNAPNKFMGSGMLPGGAYVTLEHEYILILRNGDRRTVPPTDRERRRRSAFFWEERNAWFSDFWDLKGRGQGLTGSDARRRSGAFPPELPFRLINMYSLEGDTVLDPFMGTGTTTVAAIATARNSIGVELDTALSEVIDGSVTGAAEYGRRRQRERIDRHVEFVEHRRGERKTPLKHHNAVYGFPVMTQQEIDLVLPVAEDVSVGPDDPAGPDDADVEYHVRHRPLKLVEGGGQLPLIPLQDTV